jgi:hypothetical protein
MRGADWRALVSAPSGAMELISTPPRRGSPVNENTGLSPPYPPLCLIAIEAISLSNQL